MVNVGDKFGDYIKEGFDLFKENAAVLILASLIALAIATVSLGILAGPMMAGLIIIILRIKDGDPQQPTAGDVFQGFQYFLPTFLYVVVWTLILIIPMLILAFIPCLGPILMICLSLAAAAFLMFSFFLIVDQKMDFWSASMASFAKVKESFFPYLGISAVAMLIGQLGSIACGIGVIATMPIQWAILAVCYRDVFGPGQAPAPAAPAQETKPPQPPAAPVDPPTSSPDDAGGAGDPGDMGGGE